MIFSRRFLRLAALAPALVIWVCPSSGAQELLRPAPEGFSWRLEDTWADVEPDRAGRWPDVRPANTRGYRDTTDDRGGTITANCDHFPNEGHQNAFDNSGAKWCARQADIRIDYQYPDGARETIVAYTVTSANDYPGRDPRDWQLLGSNDGETWTVVDEREGETFMTRHFKRLFEVADPGAYNRYRFVVLKNGGEPKSQIEELEYLVRTEPEVPASDEEIAAALAKARAGEGFQPLFDDGLEGARMQRDSWVYEDGVLTARGGGDIWSAGRYGDFVLELDFRCETNTNSGVFLRCPNIRDWLHGSIEVQILQPEADNPRHNCGGIFDVLAPADRVLKPVGEWNHYTIVALRNRIVVVLNGERVTDIDLNRWTEAGRNPDGTPNKFRRAYANMPRRGRIGLQYHGQPISFRNIRVMPLE